MRLKDKVAHITGQTNDPNGGRSAPNYTVPVAE